MRFLFLHQNFPAQFLHLVQMLKGMRDVELRAITDRRNARPSLIPTIRYDFTPSVLPHDELTSNFRHRVERGQVVAAAMQHLKTNDFTPDVVIGHFGWGETLFVKDVFPTAKLIVHAEFYYQPQGADIGFDPEFPSKNRTLLALAKNAAILSALAEADYGVAPTHWQASRFPRHFAKRIAIIHEGIDTVRAAPDRSVRFANAGASLDFGAEDEVITFVNRNLEPYRGYHVFMRALPRILAKRPSARVVIVGGDDVSYGRAAPVGTSWKKTFLDEVRDELPLDRVHFVGKIPYPDLIALLRISSAHVYLTYPFVLSWSMLDALSVGALVIASDTAPVREVIRDGVNGLLVGFFDIEGLANRVIEALASPIHFEVIRKAARETIVERYERVSCLQRWLTFIDVIQRGSGPSK